MKRGGPGEGAGEAQRQGSAALDRVFGALADPTRRALLDRLAAGPATTGSLVAAAPHLSRTGVLKHLDVLRSAGLVLTRRRGRERWNHLNAAPLQAAYDRWVARHVRGLSRSAARLAAHLQAHPDPPPAPDPGTSTPEDPS